MDVYVEKTVVIKMDEYNARRIIAAMKDVTGCDEIDSETIFQAGLIATELEKALDLPTT